MLLSSLNSILNRSRVVILIDQMGGIEKEYPKKNWKLALIHSSMHSIRSDWNFPEFVTLPEDDKRSNIRRRLFSLDFQDRVDSLKIISNISS